jgi:hypothetical protein
LLILKLSIFFNSFFCIIQFFLFYCLYMRSKRVFNCKNAQGQQLVKKKNIIWSISNTVHPPLRFQFPTTDGPCDSNNQYTSTHHPSHHLNRFDFTHFRHVSVTTPFALGFDSALTSFRRLLRSQTFCPKIITQQQ